MNIPTSDPGKPCRSALLGLQRWLVALALGIAALTPAVAGTVHFGMARQDNRLQLTNLGNTSAYHTQMYRLLADGRWQALMPLPGQTPTVELAPHQPLELLWPGTPPGQPDPAVGPFASMLPVLVRFFDQSGAAFGQISFFSQPPVTGTPLAAGYRNDVLEIRPPDNPRIRASWLLWAPESGIAPLAGAVVYEHHQPAAIRLDWQKTREIQRQRTSAALPAAMLLHETDTGFEMQPVPGGGLQGIEQRALWLLAFPGFYKLALLALIAAVLVFGWQLIAFWRKKK